MEETSESAARSVTEVSGKTAEMVHRMASGRTDRIYTRLAKDEILHGIRMNPRVKRIVRTSAGEPGTEKGAAKPAKPAKPSSGSSGRAEAGAPVISAKLKGSGMKYATRYIVIPSSRADAPRVKGKEIAGRIDKTPQTAGKVKTRVKETVATSLLQSGVGLTRYMDKKPRINHPAGRGAVSAAGGAMRGSDDAGAEAAGVTVTGAVTAGRSIKTIYKAGRGVYQVGLTGALGVVTLAKTAGVIKGGKAVTKDGAVKALKVSAGETGLAKTLVSRRIVHSINGMRTRAANARKAVKAAAEAVRRQGIVKAAASGAVKVAKGTGRGIGKITGKGLRGFAKNGPGAAGAAMAASGDETVSSVGKVATGVETGVRTGVQVAKATKRTVKTGVKAAEGVAKGARRVAGRGVRATVRAAASAVTHAVTAAAAGAATAAPWIALIVAVIVVIVCVVAGSTGIVGVLMGGSFEVDGEEFDIGEYLEERIPGMLGNFRDNLRAEMELYAEYDTYDCDIVRLYASDGTGIAYTVDDIDSVIPSERELEDILEPLYNALLVTYDMSPTRAEADRLLEDLFDSLLSYETSYDRGEYIVEYCGQDLKTGAGTPEECGACSDEYGGAVYHALDDCPRHTTYYHGAYTCDECDTEEYSRGALACGKEEHEHTAACYSLQIVGDSIENVLTCGKEEHEHRQWASADDPGCYSTDTRFECTGCEHCLGHRVVNFYMMESGAAALEQGQLTEPIDTLLAIPEEERTEEEQEQLETLQDAKELYEALCEEYGLMTGSFTVSDLSGVEWVLGERTPCQEVVDLALGEIGNAGGEKYWSYLGFKSRVSWCACFVNWCMVNCPESKPYFPITSNNASCQTLADWFMENGQWGSRDFTDLVAGDIIFYDFDGEGVTHHTGIVVGTDGTNVYVVEGNKSDAVGTRTVALGSDSIYGYGLMNYGG